MAGRIAATVAVIPLLLLFFTLAHAIVPVDLPDDAASISLLTGKPDTETEIKYATNEPEYQTRIPAQEIETEFKMLSEKEIKTETGTEMKTETVPLTVISLRPTNRHFPRLPFIRRGHKCRHQFHRGTIKPWLVRLINRHERSYGNDMILAGDGEGDGMRFDLVSRNGDLKTVPATLSRSPFEHEVRKSHHKHEHEHEHEHEHDEHDYHRHRHHDHHRVEEKEYEREEREREHDHGLKHKGEFLRKIRKFLNGF